MFKSADATALQNNDTETRSVTTVDDLEPDIEVEEGMMFDCD